MVPCYEMRWMLDVMRFHVLEGRMADCKFKLECLFSPVYLIRFHWSIHCSWFMIHEDESWNEYCTFEMRLRLDTRWDIDQVIQYSMPPPSLFDVRCSFIRWQQHIMEWLIRDFALFLNNDTHSHIFRTNHEITIPYWYSIWYPTMQYYSQTSSYARRPILRR